MIISLPKHFFYERGNSLVYVGNGRMILHGNINFEMIMKKIILKTEDRTTCHYCGRRVNPSKITVEHMYPTAFGGPSITTNFVLACATCNQEKGALNLTEYQCWKAFKSRKDRSDYYRKTIEKKTRRLENPNVVGYDIPRYWIKYRKTSQICLRKRTISIKNTKKYTKIRNFATTYSKLPRPIVVSSNNYLLTEYQELAIAQELEFKTVPVIILENVIVL